MLCVIFQSQSPSRHDKSPADGSPPLKSPTRFQSLRSPRRNFPAPSAVESSQSLPALLQPAPAKQLVSHQSETVARPVIATVSQSEKSAYSVTSAVDQSKITNPPTAEVHKTAAPDNQMTPSDSSTNNLTSAKTVLLSRIFSKQPAGKCSRNIWCFFVLLLLC